MSLFSAPQTGDVLCNIQLLKEIEGQGQLIRDAGDSTSQKAKRS